MKIISFLLIFTFLGINGNCQIIDNFTFESKQVSIVYDTITDNTTCQKQVITRETIISVYTFKDTCYVPLVKTEKICDYTKTVWIEPYTDCKLAPTGQYFIQFLYTKEAKPERLNISFEYDTVVDPCGIKYYVKKTFYNYCKAQEFLRDKVSSEFPDAYIRRYKN